MGELPWVFTNRKVECASRQDYAKQHTVLKRLRYYDADGLKARDELYSTKEYSIASGIAKVVQPYDPAGKTGQVDVDGPAASA